ncbi:MAG: GTP-binding protein [Candidatus Helarchaeales archaeon]
MSQEEIYSFKIVCIGSPAVGKTSLINRFVTNSFKEKYIETIGVNILLKELKVDSKTVQLSCWDVAGQTHFGRVRNMYYRGAQGALIVFDLTRPSTYLDVGDFHEDLKTALNNKDIPIVLIGNKKDLKDELVKLDKSVLKEGVEPIDTKKGEEMKQLIGAIKYIETSAKSGENVEEAFKTLAEALAK